MGGEAAEAVSTIAVVVVFWECDYEHLRQNLIHVFYCEFISLSRSSWKFRM